MIVPAYNAEATLKQSVESALGGTFSDIEVILVDDGSTDGTAAVAEALAHADARVKAHWRKNGGVSAALNSGLALARGDYVARLDSDDIWHPAKLERQLHAAYRMPEAAFIYSFVRYIDMGGRVVSDGPDQRFPPHALCRGFYESLVGANSTALMRRSVVADMGGYDESLASWEDLLLQLRISARAPIACLPEYLVGYRIRPGSLSKNLDGMLESWRQVRTKARHAFPAVPSFVHKWAHAHRCAAFAEGFAWRGQYGKCLRLLSEAAAADLRWTQLMLRFRTGRRLRSATGRQAGPEALPLFSQCDPARRAAPSPEQQSTARLQALQAKRIATLTQLDEALAERRT